MSATDRQASSAASTKRERELVADVRERLLDISEGLASEVSLEPDEAEVLLNRFFTVEASRV